MRVLVVDDDPDFCESIRGIIESDGMEVVLAHSRKEARRKLEVTGNGFEVALIDMYMEEQDSGLRLIRYIEKKRLPIVAIVITGYGKVGNAVECMKAGAFDYIEKGVPDQTELIRLAIRNAREVRIARMWASAVINLRPHLQGLVRELNEAIDYLRRFVDEIPDTVVNIEEHRTRGCKRKGS